MQEKYDVIVVGGGLAGLTLANRLGKQGYSVLLLEQHHKVGGLATWFERKGGYTFDVSLHCLPYDMKQAYAFYWNKEIANQLIRLGKIRFDNPQFHLDTTYDIQDFKKILHEKFSLAQNIINTFFETVKSTTLDSSKITVKELFDKFFPNRNDVVRFLMEMSVYTNGFSLDDPASVYCLVFSKFIKGGLFTFRGGTDKMISMMLSELSKNNVDVVTRTMVDKIIVKNGKVDGVVTDGKDMFHANAVVSNSNLLSTIHDLVGDDCFSHNFLERVAKVRLSQSNSQVYIGIKEGELVPYVGDLILCSTNNVFDSRAILAKDVTSQAFSFYYPNFREGNTHCTIVACINSRYEDWQCLSKTEYKKEKNKLIKAAVCGLDKYVPGMQQKIGYVEAATPRTIERYTLHKMGASAGTKFEGLDLSKKISSSVKGLFHAGSTGIVMSGWLGAISYGAITSYAVEKYLNDN